MTSLGMTSLGFPVIVQPLSDSDGGGYAAIVADLPACMSDGGTPEEALVNVADAISSWIEAADELGHAVPIPSWHPAPALAGARAE